MGPKLAVVYKLHCTDTFCGYMKLYLLGRPFVGENETLADAWYSLCTI